MHFTARLNNLPWPVCKKCSIRNEVHVLLSTYVYITQVYFELVLWQVSIVVTFIGGFTEATGIVDSIN